MTITTAWIDEGCIGCGACATVCPQVFTLPASDAEIVAAARTDGLGGSNREQRSPLLAQVIAACRDEIEEAAAGCPVDVIRLVA
ncbi:MAG TPA: ferredoxin [Planctomycetota bacterium]|nr:ferredoxin [Planctomycetota bacterium]